MQDMQRGRKRHRALVSPLQMQWQYQACSPGLPDGMAVALAKEALRALQNPIPIYKVILAQYATVTPSRCLLPSLPPSFGPQYCDLVEILFGEHCLAGMPSIRYTTNLAALVLVQ